MFWIDVFVFLFCPYKKYYEVYGLKYYDIIIARSDKDIWEKVEGYTENIWNTKYKWICSNCKYYSNTFNEFIQKFKGNKIKEDDINNTSTNIISLNSTLNLNEDLIVVFSISSASIINYSVSCKKTDKFSFVVNKLYEEYPEYKNKKCNFYSKDRLLNLDKTIAENNINKGDKINVNFV